MRLAATISRLGVGNLDVKMLSLLVVQRVWDGSGGPDRRQAKIVCHGICGQGGRSAGESGYHGSNDDVISGEAFKGLEPTCPIFPERIPFEESGVECVCVINKLLEVFQGNLGCGRGTPQVFEGGKKSHQSRLEYVLERRGNTMNR